MVSHFPDFWGGFLREIVFCSFRIQVYWYLQRGWKFTGLLTRFSQISHTQYLWNDANFQLWHRKCDFQKRKSGFFRGRIRGARFLTCARWWEFKLRFIWFSHHFLQLFNCTSLCSTLPYNCASGPEVQATPGALGHCNLQIDNVLGDRGFQQKVNRVFKLPIYHTNSKMPSWSKNMHLQCPGKSQSEA